MSQVSATCRIATGSNSTDLSNVDKHNNRKFSQETEYLESTINLELAKENVTLIGTDNIVTDLKETYNQVFGKAVTDYNEKQKRSDRKIYDYYEKINSSKKANLYAEVVLQFADKEFWEDKTLEERKEIYIPFAKEQIKIFKELNPNFAIANAVIHFDETTPHVQLVGIGFETGKKRGMEIQATTSIAKNKRELSQKQALYKQKCVDRYNELYHTNLELKPKQPRRQHLTTKEYKENKEKLQERVKNLKQIVEKKGVFDKVILTTAQLKEINKFLDDEVSITHNEELKSELEKTILEQKKEIAQLQQRSKVLQATLDRLETNNKRYTSSIRNNGRILKNQVRNIQRNRQTERNLTQTITKLSSEQKEMEETTKKIEQQLVIGTQKLNELLEKLQLVDDLKSLRDKALKMKAENQELEKKNTHLKDKNQELKKENDQLTTKHKKLTTEISEKETEKKEVQSLILSRDKISREVQELKNTKIQLETTNKNLNQKNKQLTSSVTDLQEQQKTLVVTTSGLKKVHQELQESSLNLIENKYKELEKLAQLPINKKLSWTLNPTGTKELEKVLEENRLLQLYYSETIKTKENQDLMKGILERKAAEKEKVNVWDKHMAQGKNKGLSRD